MNATEYAHGPKWRDRVDAACGRIAPLWPLKNFVAVNPYVGLRDQSFWQAHETLLRVAGTGLCMPRAYYMERLANGRITHDDLQEALRASGSSWDVPAFRQMLERGNRPSPPLPLVADVLGGLDGQDWSSFVVERVSQYCAAYFDEGQALWRMPWRDQSLYSGWREFARIDKSPRMMGLRGMGEAIGALPDTAEGAMAWALDRLAVPTAAVDDYLYAALLSVGGWAGWARYLRWQAEPQERRDDSLRDLLAIRLAWDALLYTLRGGEGLAIQWERAMAVNLESRRRAGAAAVDVVLHTAFEAGYQRRLAATLTAGRRAETESGRVAVQAVFCIDVRSEVYRRALETVAPGTRTLGFAGFFGVPMEYVPFGGAAAKAHLPVLLTPSYRICERPDCAHGQEFGKRIARRQARMRTVGAWKTFKTSASSSFSFVGAAGLLSAPKLVSDSLGWTRPVAHPGRKGLSGSLHRRLAPALTSEKAGPGGCADGVPTGIPTGIPEADRPGAAAFILRHMGMIRDFARLVLFVGHGSTTVNNPQATALDCGACAGQSGEASARIAVALLNDPSTRRGLAQMGIEVPDDTYFVAGLHDTTTDEIQLFDADAAPPSHAVEVAQLRRSLAAAGQLARMERATLLGTGGLPAHRVHADMRRRTRDWAQVRPEWALAGNAAFIAAPRARTAHCDLAGRVFLHEYDWRDDADFGTLRLMMTAPMIVAHWINMQYYGSMVDNRHFGSGNKVLHNVVGGSIGVLEGNGGDLRVGLALQSLHDGARWMHEPMRLNVVIEAPQQAIDDVIAGHDVVRELVGNAWIHLFCIDEEGGLKRCGTDRQWRDYQASGLTP